MTKHIEMQNVRTLPQGLEEIIKVDEQSADSLVGYTVELPKIPKSFKNLFSIKGKTRFDEFAFEDACDCGNQKTLLKDCPHFKDATFAALLNVLPKRLAHLELIKPKCCDQIKKHLFEQVMQDLKALPCSGISVKKPVALEQMPVATTGVKPQNACHIYRDLEKLFPTEYKNYFEPENAGHTKDKSCRITNVVINLSFYSNFVILACNIISLILSKSMSVLAAMMESLFDCLSGVVLFIALKLASKGIQRGDFQRTLHENEQTVKYFYAQRYEALGILGFSCIMATLALILIYESILNIMKIVHGEETKLQFDVGPIVVLGFAIISKFTLCIICWIVAKRYFHLRESIITYRDDHRNDSMSDSTAFLGAALSYFLKGNWKYCDPIASIILAAYICFAWGEKAVEQLRGLAGHKTDKAQMDELLMRLLHQFACTVFMTEVDSFIGYSSGSQTVLEMRISVPSGITIAGAHSIIQQIQNAFEKVEGIERCYVHVESKDCKNLFEGLDD